MKAILVLAPIGFSIFFCIALLSLEPILCDLSTGGGLQHCLPPDTSVPKCGPIGVEQPREVNDYSSLNKDQLSLFGVISHYLRNYSLYSGTPSFLIEELQRKSEKTLALLYSSIAFIMNQIFELPNLLTTMTSLSNCISGNLTVLALPLLYGFSVVLFSWMLIYHDSKVPGVYPPSPLSPKKFRERSGHTFHLGYTVGLINGLVVFALSLWSQLSY